jgi:hypothetical protein
MNFYHEQDARKRYSASDVLVHPWLRSGGASSALLLPTPALMRQNNNSKQLSQFADSAAAVNRVLLQHLSGTYIYSSPALFRKPVIFQSNFAKLSGTYIDHPPCSSKPFIFLSNFANLSGTYEYIYSSPALFCTVIQYRTRSSVADPGCLSRDPNFFHPGSASKNLSILTQNIVSKLSEKWSGLFIPDPDFYPSRIPDPGVNKAPDLGSGSATLARPILQSR